MSESSSLPFRYSMYRLSRRSSSEVLGTGSIAKPSSAASLKSSLGFIAVSLDAFSPSATSVLTVSSAAFPSFTIRLALFCWILRQNRAPEDPLSIEAPGPLRKIKSRLQISTRLHENCSPYGAWGAEQAVDRDRGAVGRKSRRAQSMANIFNKSRRV
jgi:hypothetical protein